jgi:hypothetical protein
LQPPHIQRTAIIRRVFSALISPSTTHAAHFYFSRILPKSLGKFSQLHIAITVKTHQAYMPPAFQADLHNAIYVLI